MTDKIVINGAAGKINLTDVTPTISGSGLTSYQRAVLAGFSGTETDFYAGQALSANIYPIADLPPLP